MINYLEQSILQKVLNDVYITTTLIVYDSMRYL